MTDDLTPIADPRGSRTWKAIRAALVIAGVQVAAAMLLAVAYKLGVIGLETLMRGGMVVCGLGLAAVGNTMPKLMDDSTPGSLAAAARRQDVYRVGGWAMTLAGLVFAGLWAFAPFTVAVNGCVVALGAGIAVMFGYKAWRAYTSRRRASAS